AGMAVDMAVLVADNEFISMIRQIVGGIPTDDDTLMIEEIVERGPEAEYISARSTLQNVNLLSAPRLIDRHSREEWASLGSTDLYTRARDEARRILADTQVEPLPNVVAEKLDRIVEEADLKYAGVAAHV
ncbi:MAG TPA: trimethylamine methyltransferase family protein, partial [Thermoleophilia bacterium]|nr:trimethylamine methyltransferase family protein [Thermoleophilia bacterium]